MAVRRVDLAHLKPARGSRKKPKRLGRGPGSGHGKTAGQGYKGQLSRGSGKLPYAGFEGESDLLEGLHKRGLAGATLAPALYRADGLLMFWSHAPVAPYTVRPLQTST